jgi:hypothetical protein
MPNPMTMDVYTVVDRSNGQAVVRRLWLKIGVCTANRDGSLTVQLDAYPRDGKLQIRTSAPEGAVTVKG